MGLPKFEDTQRRYGLIQEDARQPQRHRPTADVEIGGVSLDKLTDEQLRETVRECERLLLARSESEK